MRPINGCTTSVKLRCVWKLVLLLMDMNTLVGFHLHHYITGQRCRLTGEETVTSTAVPSFPGLILAVSFSPPSTFIPHLGNVHRCVIDCHLKFSRASNLVYIRVIPRVRQDVKACVNIVEQVDYLDGSLGRGVLAAEGVESHDAAEEDRHVVVALCRHGPLVTQLVGNRWWQNRIKQSKEGERERETERETDIRRWIHAAC